MEIYRGEDLQLSFVNLLATIWGDSQPARRKGTDSSRHDIRKAARPRRSRAAFQFPAGVCTGQGAWTVASETGLFSRAFDSWRGRPGVRFAPSWLRAVRGDRLVARMEPMGARMRVPTAQSGVYGSRRRSPSKRSQAGACALDLPEDFRPAASVAPAHRALRTTTGSCANRSARARLGAPASAPSIA